MKIATIVGARPQFVKAATVSRAIRSRSGMREVLVHTGQHFDENMSDVFFREMDIPAPDFNLGIGGGTHGQNTGRMLEAIERVLEEVRPDWVLVYGDTDSTLAGALTAAKMGLRLAHVEAGLRSFNRRMPEEINRVLTDHVSDFLFVPTRHAEDNLANEGIRGDHVKLVGDVMFDATRFYESKARKPDSVNTQDGQPFILCTVHRAENTDDPLRLHAIAGLLNRLAADGLRVVFPLHPRTRRALGRLDNTSLDSRIQVVDPVGFLEMTWLLSHCEQVLTDSGGVQKEAYFHRKPCVTLRSETEWLELVEAGCNRLVSPLAADAVDQIMEMRSVSFVGIDSLYGNGRAASEIVAELAANR